MQWLKDIFLDIIVLILVIVYSLFTYQALEVILWIYTGLLIIGKVLAFYMPSLNRRANKTTVPGYIYHIIYLLITAALFYSGDIYLAAAWLFIWVISAYQNYSANKSNN